MFISLCNWFVKITAWPVQKLLLRIRFEYEDRNVQNRSLRGPAIIISNHTSVYDYAVLLFTFFSRTLRVQMAEVLFDKKLLGAFLRMMGGIRIDRHTHSIAGLTQSEAILRKGGVVGIFPESRLPLPGEDRPLPFQHGAAYLSLSAGVPIIPVYISGRYFSKDRMRIRIGTPVDLRSIAAEYPDEHAAVRECSRLLREKVINLGKGMNNET